MSVVHDIAATVLAAPSPSPAPGGGGGLLDWGNGKVAEVGTFFRGLSVVAGIGFVIFQALVSRGAFSRIVVSGLAAAVFIWIVWNVTDLKERVGKDLQAASSTSADGYKLSTPDGYKFIASDGYKLSEGRVAAGYSR